MYILKQLFFSISVNSGFGNIFDSRIFWGERIFGKYFFTGHDLKRVLGEFKTI